MTVVIQLRGDTAANWASSNPVLAEREMAVVLDTGRFKIGDGVTAWNALAYPPESPVTGLTTYLDGAEPGAPEDGSLHLFAADSGGRMLPRFKGPSGLESALKPALFGNGIYMVSPGTTTAMNVIGGPAVTNVGTMSHPVLNQASLRQQTSRGSVVSAATANAAAETRSTFARVWRGDQPGLGGFFFRVRFSIVSTVALQRTLIGLTSATAATAVTQDPVALLNWVGIGNASDDANLQVLVNNGSGAAVKTDLGSDFPSQGVDDIYELTLFAPPNASHVDWRVQRLGLGVSQSGRLTGTLPSQSQFLAPHVYMNNGGTDQGIQGVEGPQGETGAPGDQGPQGEQGLQGIPGDTGPKGDTGDTGPKGDTGDEGPQGIQGVKGDTGAKGDKGDTGAAGSPGAQGEQGIPGVKGDPGDEGPEGPEGPQGIQGIPGTPGAKGEKGDTGDTGPAGADGDSWVPSPVGQDDGKVLTVDSDDAVWAEPSGGGGDPTGVDGLDLMFPPTPGLGMVLAAYPDNNQLFPLMGVDTGDVLTWTGYGDPAFEPPPGKKFVSEVTHTVNKTLAAADRERILTMNSASARTFTLPNSLAGVNNGNTFNLVRRGAGAVNLVTGTSVVVNGVTNPTIVLDQWALYSITRTSAINNYLMSKAAAA